MLYTIVPLERIYSYRTKSIIASKRNTAEKQDLEKDEFVNIALQHGQVYARRDGDHYVVDGICSTDMNDYLNENYSLGASISYPGADVTN